MVVILFCSDILPLSTGHTYCPDTTRIYTLSDLSWIWELIQHNIKENKLSLTIFPLLLRGSNVFRRFTETAHADSSILDIFTLERAYWDPGFNANLGLLRLSEPGIISCQNLTAFIPKKFDVIALSLVTGLKHYSKK